VARRDAIQTLQEDEPLKCEALFFGDFLLGQQKNVTRHAGPRPGGLLHARAMTDFLRLQGIRKSFGAFEALKDIDLSIAKGEFVCFLGPSGCGKTTLLRIIAGLEAQTSGRIEQNGRDISSLPPAQRDYGIVFQSYALFPNLSVADNVAYGLVNRKLPREQIRTRVAELLKLVGLPGSEDKYPAQLSGGQQQRIALARALATSPGLLLLDEPLSALDAIVRVHLRQEIRSLQRKLGVTTIMVTHDQEEALAVADRIVVMNQGVIEQVGTPLQVYRDPATLFVADFVGRINALPATLEAGGRVRVGKDTQGHSFECAHEGAPGAAVKIYLRPEDVLARPIAPGDSNVFEADIDKIEFLGSYCLVRVKSEALGEHRLTVYLSLNFLAEQRLEIGGRLPLRLLPERMRIFA
jgi:iron(III) transport system ATP-binding protein